MNINELRAFLDDCLARGVSGNEDVFVDAESEADGVVRLVLAEAEIECAHDEDETPFVVLTAEELHLSSQQSGETKP